MTRDNVVTILGNITEWSLYILIFSLPFSKSIIEICVGLAFSCWLLKKILTKDLRIKNTPLNGLLLVFLIASSISIINTDARLFVMRSLFSKCLKYIALYFVVVETIDSRDKLKKLLKITMLSAAIVIIDSYLQLYIFHIDLIRLYPAFKYVDYTPFHGFPTGPFPFPNDLSAWLLIISVTLLSLVIWNTDSRLWRAVLAAFLAPCLFLFYLANTRSAWFGFIISSFLILLVQNKKVIMVAIVLLALLSLPFLSSERVKDIFAFSSMQDRFYMWRIGWKAFLEHPLVGNGFNTFFGKFRELREDEYRGLKGSHAHNGYLQLAADTGILGLALFLLLLGKAFYSVFRYINVTNDRFYKALALGLGAGLLAFLIHSFFDTNLQSLPLAALFWFSLAVLMGLITAREGA